MSEKKPEPNSARLLHTKLMPPRLPSSAIQRDDLLARLDAGLTKKVILLAAPTGFGKTTLVRSARYWLTREKNDVQLSDVGWG